MPRSRRIRPDLIPRVKLAVKHNGFLRQQDLVEEVGLASSTVRNFLNGKPVDYATFVQLCQKLNLEWRDFADLGEAAKPHQESGEVIDASASELNSEQAVLEQFQPSYSLSGEKENTKAPRKEEEVGEEERSHLAEAHRAKNKMKEKQYSEGKDLMSFATTMLEQLGFDQKFKMNRTSQYTGYRLKNPGERAKSYLLVLAQGKEGLGISIYRDILNPYVLELKFYDDVLVSDEYGYVAECQKFYRLYWVIPSKEDIFFEISQDYKDIFSGESIGSFSLDPKGIDPYDVIHKGLQGFKLKRSEDSRFDWHFDHEDYLARLEQSNCCVSIDNIDRLFPHTLKVYINSIEIIEEFIHYFGGILMESY